jgi:hypothetical protein
LRQPATKARSGSKTRRRYRRQPEVHYRREDNVMVGSSIAQPVTLFGGQRRLDDVEYLLDRLARKLAANKNTLGRTVGKHWATR